MTKRYDTAYFIELATAKHGDRYDYSKSIYESSIRKIIITCKEHGDFYMKPTHHLEGRGCRDCANRARSKTTHQFISEARSVHGELYSYSAVKYKNKNTHVVVDCRQHGGFKIRPHNHLKGQGCPKCGDRLKTKEQFIIDSEAVHGKGTYGYECLEYKNAKSNVALVCKHHGLFEIRARHHLDGQGCPNCSIINSGFCRSSFVAACGKNNDIGELYVIRCYHSSESFYKVGITARSAEERFRSKSAMPYRFDVLYRVHDRSEFIFNIEARLHKLLGEHKYKPKIFFAGHTECFATIKPIEKLLKELSTTEQLQLLA